MKKIIAVSTIAACGVLFGLSNGFAEENSAAKAVSADPTQAVNFLRDAFGADFQKFDFSVDETGRLSYKAVKSSDEGEAISEKSFALMDIDEKSIAITPQGSMSFSCMNSKPCITYYRKEAYKNRRDYQRQLKLQKDAFPIASNSSSASASGKVKESFQSLIQLFSKKPE